MGRVFTAGSEDEEIEKCIKELNEKSRFLILTSFLKMF